MIGFVADRKLMGKELSNFSPIIVPPMQSVPFVLLSLSVNDDLVPHFLQIKFS